MLFLLVFLLSLAEQLPHVGLRVFRGGNTRGRLPALCGASLGLDGDLNQAHDEFPGQPSPTVRWWFASSSLRVCVTLQGGDYSEWSNGLGYRSSAYV